MQNPTAKDLIVELIAINKRLAQVANNPSMTKHLTTDDAVALDMMNDKLSDIIERAKGPVL